MSDHFDMMLKLDVVELDNLQQRYAKNNDRSGVALIDRVLAAKGPPAQTEKLSHCGRLYKNSRTDPETGRLTHSWTGDWFAGFSPFMLTDPQMVRVNRGLFSGANGPEALNYARKEQEERQEFEAFRAARSSKKR
jgi:hypothetical protein